MTESLNRAALEQLFLSARTYNAWRPDPIPRETIRALYELFKWGPTSANSSPARFVWVDTETGKARLAGLAAEGNRAKILAAPVTAIIGHDLAFAERLPELAPQRWERIKPMFDNPAVAEVTAFRNGSLQGAYLIVAARAMGLDCGPMSGFDNEAVDRVFFAGTSIKSNFICSLGFGEAAGVYPRNPRLSFESVSRFA